MRACAVLVVCALLLAGCDAPSAPDWLRRPLLSPRESGKLVVLTVHGPTTLMPNPGGYKPRSDEEQAGFENDLARLFARELGVALEFVVLPNHAGLLDALERSVGHLAAGQVNPSEELRQRLQFGPAYKSLQFQLIYRVADQRPRTMSDAVGKRIAVIAESAAHDLLRDLTGTFPGIILDVLPGASHPDELLRRVESRQTDFAVFDQLGFGVNRRLHPDLAAAFNVGRELKVAWAFSPAADAELRQSARLFFDKVRANGTLARLQDRYFGHTGRIHAIDSVALLAKIPSVLPKLRALFQEAQDVSGIEWRLLAAIGYQESHWDASATSPTGVRGLMMLTEDTADRMKVKNRLDPRESILGGAKYLAMLRATVPARIAEPDRTWLALAAYNQGYGHLEDARILTQKLRLNADSWLDVRKAYPLLRDPQYFEALKYGFARGDEAVHFVESVRNYYDILARLEPPHQQETLYSERSLAEADPRQSWSWSAQ